MEAPSNKLQVAMHHMQPGLTEFREMNTAP